MSISDGISVVSKVCDCLYLPVTRRIGLLRSLPTKAADLTREARAVGALKNDVLAKIRRLVASDQHLEQSSEATLWLSSVETLLDSSRDFRANFEGRRPSCSCIKPGCGNNYKLAKEARDLLKEARLLADKGNSFTDDQLVVAAPPASLEEIPIYFEAVGQEEELAEALRLVDDAAADNMVGIWGMGGSGKTTLLKRINNHFCSMDACGFDVVLYATAGRDCSVAMMQKEIAKRLGISLSDRGDEEDHARQIFLSLRSKKSFLLLLDDLWEVMDLETLGIPPLNSNPQKMQKMVITSRYKGVCSRMAVTEKCLIQMGLLSAEESWRVFCKCVGNEEVLRDPRIVQLAVDVANECGRLPLALVTVGKAMAGATAEEEWRNARSELQKSAAHEIPGMKDEVLSRLKFSFDRLEDEAMREIMFVVHASIRKNYHLKTLEIARRIVAEGLLDDVCNDIDLASAKDKAQTLIIRLVNSGLLMWYGRKRSKVTIHDCIYDMLAWLMDTQENKYPRMVRWPSSLDDYSTTEQLQLFFRRWEQAKRIVMDFSQLKEIPENTEMPSCSLLFTLTWFKGKIVRLPEVFFYHMPSMRFLNLGCSDIEDLPGSVGSLANLKFLSLGWTNITRLPIQIGDLQQLRELYLNNTSKLKDIPCESILRLHLLEILIITFSKFRWTWDNNGDSNNDPDRGDKNITLQDLQELKKSGVLTQIDLSLVISNQDDLNRLADSPMLPHLITGLELINTCKDSLDMGEQIAFLLTKMERLQELWLHNLVPSAYLQGSGISYTLPALELLELANCPGILNLEWISRAPCLRELYLTNCENIKYLFPSEGDNVLLENGETRQFPHLRKLDIHNCPKLSCISKSLQLFPSLEKLIVEGCPELRNLHFDEQSASKIRKIKGSEEWWNNLEWENERVKSRLLHCYFQLT